MDITEQIKNTEEMLRFTQDYLGVIKLLKTVKTGIADLNLKDTAKALKEKIKEYVEVI